MAVVSMSYLLEAGVHFGHQTKRWNPKMKEYIFNSRDDIYIIDLEKTQNLLEEAYNEIKSIAANGGKFLFVGTKKQSGEVAVEEAARSNSYYVTERWLGGTLTNFRTIRRRVRRLEEIEEMEANGTFDVLPKKEVIGLKKEYEKLNRLLCGIREMSKLPQALIIVDPKKECNAIKEARKLKIPVFGVVDTNGDPDLVDYVIPGNDDAVKSIKVLLGVLNNAICEATGLEMIDYVSEDDKAKSKENKSMDTLLKEAPVNEAAKEAKESDVYTVTDIVEEKEEVAVNNATQADDDLESKTLAELKAMAKDKNIKGYSTMKKADLIAALK